MGYSREDVETHYDRERRPAVNVKVYRGIEDAFRTIDRTDFDIEDERFTLEWVEEHISDDLLDSYFWDTCEWEFEQVQADAEDIFGAGVKCYREGRSGGWAVVDGLPDLEGWDAVMLAKWRKFERYAKQTAHYIPEQMLGNIYLNAFMAWADEQEDADAQNTEVPLDLHVA